MAYKKLTIYTDGGARGNPGPAAIGVVIKHGAETIKEFGRYLGETTNNQAEYRALISGLEHCAELGAEEVECMLDSELVVKQMNHQYRVKDADLAPLFLKVYNLSQQFKKTTFHHIPREKNKEADKMVNDALDRQIK
ncbi:ribonuclease HI family protein [Candidatus Uhrbacteria bacterium]|nr:ribonuclease HI family protein [Candidatus Uhrbacteria bacterium]